MILSELSALRVAQKITYNIHSNSDSLGWVGSEIISRAVALAFLSLSACFDLVIHTSLLLSSMVYELGKSIKNGRLDLNLTKQHLERVRISVAPVLLGSVSGLLHPELGILVSDSSEKNSVVGMLSSNNQGYLKFDTICSPLDSYSVLSKIANRKKVGLSEDCKKALKDLKYFEGRLQILQAQDYCLNFLNIWKPIQDKIDASDQRVFKNNLAIYSLKALSIVAKPIFSLLDFAVSVVVQAIFLVAGVSRLITNRGPIYTEVTTNPLFHLSFLILNTLKYIDSLIRIPYEILGNSETKIKCNSLASRFFKLQFGHLISVMESKMMQLKDREKLSFPTVVDPFSKSYSDPTSNMPFHSLHMTYIQVEKRGKKFHVYSINRPEVKSGEIDSVEEFGMRGIFNQRFKNLNEIEGDSDTCLSGLSLQHEIAPQGSQTNCVVSNLFALFEVLNRKAETDHNQSTFPYREIREEISSKYSFYKKDGLVEDYSEFWERHKDKDSNQTI